MSFSLETMTAFSEAISDLYSADTPVAALQAMLPRLSVMLSSRYMFVDELPDDGRPPTPLCGLHLEEWSDKVFRYPQFAHEHPGVPFVRNGGFAPVLRLSDFASSREFEQTGFFSEIFKPMEIRDQLCLAVRLPHSTLGVSFHRQKPFNDDEAYLVSLLQPHVTSAVHTGRRLAGALPSGAPAADWDIPVDSEGGLEEIGGELNRILGRYFPCDHTTRGIPEEIVRWLRQQSQAVRTLGPGSAALPTWVVARPIGRLLLHLVPGRMGSSKILRVREERGAADFSQLCAVGLTPRECEIVFWLAEGKRDAEIATILGSASKTVSKHVEHVLAKLHVETRSAAARTARDWLQQRRSIPPSHVHT